ncbi:TIGR03808 family TAT-translocated repetitive protein [Pseudohoeflea coraliihabitans]|uniref:TIGR03808 family TAT-translocated repetitive protein n=1 Tax=Pseudohoeflea coraliihabitans TaxID=2860393 RepID=UPI003D168B94
MPTRRRLLTGVSGLAGLAGLAVMSTGLVRAASAEPTLLAQADLRGGHDGDLAGLLPDVVDDQSRRLQQAIDDAAREGRILRLPAGDYYFSNLTLPDGARLAGVPGATRLIYTGRGHGLLAEGGERVALDGLVIDGANQRLGEHVRGLVQLRNVGNLTLRDVQIAGSAKYGLALEGCGGTVEQCDLSGAAEAGLYAVESRTLTIRDNHVHDCGNGGILVHRWSKGFDGTLISGNRIARIAATNGGTGPFGNGINLFRAGGVIINGNHVSDCAFSAIRANSADNCQIIGNQALHSGETAIYSEFEFSGAVIANNLIDGGTMGISVANFDRGGRLSVISGNLVRNLSTSGPYVPKNSGFGIGIAVEADASVSGNTIEGAPKWGVMAGWGPYLRDVALTGNMIRHCGAGIAVSVVEGAGATLVQGNIFSHTPQGAVIGTRWNETVTGDLARQGAEAFAHLTVRNNVAG